MPSSEIGILPQSTCLNFTSPKSASSLFLFPSGCGHIFASRDYYVKRNFFPPLLLAYIRTGKLCLEIETDHTVSYYEATAGQILLFDCTKPHHYYAAEDGLDFLYIHIDGGNSHELCAYINQSCGILIDGMQNESIQTEILGLISFYQSGGSESMFASSLRMYRILSLFDQAIMSPCLRKNDDSIHRAISYIRTHVGEKITLHQLAQISGLSDFYFSRLFKEMTGFSPNEFVINSRIDHAKTLLASTTLPISEISQQVGYPNSSNLITHFVRRVGISPMQYRKGLVNKADMPLTLDDTEPSDP